MTARVSVQGIEGPTNLQSQVNCIGTQKLFRMKISYLIKDFRSFLFLFSLETALLSPFLLFNKFFKK